MTFRKDQKLPDAEKFSSVLIPVKITSVVTGNSDFSVAQSAKTPLAALSSLPTNVGRD